MAGFGVGAGVAVVVMVIAHVALGLTLPASMALGALAAVGALATAMAAWFVGTQRLSRWLGARVQVDEAAIDDVLGDVVNAVVPRMRAAELEAGRIRAELDSANVVAARVETNLVRARRELDAQHVELAGLEHEQRLSASAISAQLDLVLGARLEPFQEELVRLARRALTEAATQDGNEPALGEDPPKDVLVPPQGFNLRRTVASVLRLLAPGADDREVEVVARFASDLPSRVEADRRLLWRTLALVVDFHIRRSQHDCVYLNVTVAEPPASARDMNERVVRFAVEHFGAPLSARAAEELFDRERGAVELAFAQRLCEAGGGALTAESTPDGLRTTLSLPVSRLKRVTVTTLYGRGALTEKAILVVDDIAHSRAVVSELISSWRLLPTAVQSGEAALEALRSASRTGQPFDAIVLDRNMPEYSGVQLLRAIRDDASIGEQRILLLDTAAGRARPLPEDVRGLVGDVVQKPVVPSELLEALTVVFAPPRTPPQVMTRPTARPEPGKRAIKVLVAEDNAVNQMFVARMLERRGHQVTVAANGADVIDYMDVSPEPYDIVLMDIQMPVLDGFETTAAIRERESRQGDGLRIPIIAVTAHAMRGEERRCLDAGMDGYIPKPIVEEHLLREIERVLPADFHRRAAEAAMKTAEPVAPKPSAPSPGPVFDEAKVLHFVAGDRDFLLSLVELFVETAPRQVDAIAASIASRDAGALQRAAHQLKGAVGNFAADGARHWASELETIGRDDQLAGAEAAFENLRGEIDRLRDGLKDLARRHGG